MCRCVATFSFMCTVKKPDLSYFHNVTLVILELQSSQTEFNSGPCIKQELKQEIIQGLNMK